MGTSYAAYAQVHLKFTIPPALLLHLAFRNIRTKRDVFLASFLTVVAVVWTIPWDSYVIINNIWTYPPAAILASTFFHIPFEEIFFMAIQTYITSQCYLIAAKSVLHPRYLPRGTRYSQMEILGGISFFALSLLGALLVVQWGRTTYLGLVLLLTCPVLLGLWCIGASHLIALPLRVTAIPIMIPTIYFWLVDGCELRRGTWVIMPATKVGFQLWSGLEIEEALFFLLTNTMIVFGAAAAHKAYAVHDTFPAMFPTGESELITLARAVCVSRTMYDTQALDDIETAYAVLQNKSKSFSTASILFEGRARLQLLQLYAYCRAADDLIDDAQSPSAAADALTTLERHLDDVYSSSSPDLKRESLREIPAYAQAALTCLAPLAPHVPQHFVHQLLAGFRTDLRFGAPGGDSDGGVPNTNKDTSSGKGEWPIATDADLVLYAQHVAGSVAGMLVHVLWPAPRAPTSTPDAVIPPLPPLDAPDAHATACAHAQNAGRALQLINIARDVPADARAGRVYIPSAALAASGLRPEDVVAWARGAGDAHTANAVRVYRAALVARAYAMWSESRGAVALLPAGVRVGVRVAVGQYLEIGEAVLRSLMIGGEAERGRAKVGRWRRVVVAWRDTRAR